MKSPKFYLLLGSVLASNMALGQTDSLKNIKNEPIKKSKAGTDEDSRNVMLNAANNTGPRDVNIGLPTTVGGITVLENYLPVVYYFWPELPNKTWRPSVSLERTNLLRMDQLASTMGDLGFAVNSYSQIGTKDLQMKGKFTTSNFGWLQGDVNISGPITKNGLSFTIGAFVNFDPSTYDLGFDNYSDRTTILRAGLTKHYDKGKININYKYAESYSISNYAVFEYGPNGKIKELDYFRIGRDSYITRDGKAKFKDVLNGNDYWAQYDGNYLHPIL